MVHAASDADVMREQLEDLLAHKHGHPGPTFECPDCIRYAAAAKILLSPMRPTEKALSQSS